MNDRIRADTAPRPVGAYPHARRVGHLLFLSGLGPRVPGTDEVPGNRYDDRGDLVEWDIEAQTRQVIANLDEVLVAARASRGDLVDITVFLTDMARDFKRFNEVYAEYFDQNGPCRTTVEVGALPTPIAVEFKCVASLGGKDER